MNRLGEQGECPSRSSRFLKKEGYWYYTTREGVDIGPFDTKGEAEAGVSDFIDFVLHADPAVVAVLSKYKTAA